jgi:hypothetical protein
MFEKNLNELIKGIRAHKGSEAKYIDAAIADCRKEVKSKDVDLKAKAVLKLAYVPALLGCSADSSCKCTATTFRGRRFRSLRSCLRRR